jgi:protein-tyrosine phosphatase
VLGVRASYLEASFVEMGEWFGAIEACFADGLGIDAAGQHAPRGCSLSDQPAGEDGCDPGV